MNLAICSLASGSSGNCYVVRGGDTFVLVDAGISGRQIRERLDRIGLSPSRLSAVLVEMISFGGSPRASINLAKAARAYAFIKRRGYVVPEDVRAVAHDVLRHRIGLTYEAEASNVTSEEIVSKIINKVEVP